MLSLLKEEMKVLVKPDLCTQNEIILVKYLTITQSLSLATPD